MPRIDSLIASIEYFSAFLLTPLVQRRVPNGSGAVAVDLKMPEIKKLLIRSGKCNTRARMTAAAG